MNAIKEEFTGEISQLEQNRSEHSETGVNAQNVREVSEVSGKGKAVIGKGDSRYWLQAGKLYADKRWRGAFSCKIQVNGRRESFPLRTTNKSAAASKAARIYGDIASLGWEAALEKHKPDETPAKSASVGGLIDAVRELADVRPATLTSNVAAFRRIVAHIAKIDASKSRYAARGTGREAWLAAVDAVPLASITPDAVEAWKLAFVSSRAGRDEVKARTARNTANTILRSAKSLFSKRLMRFISQRLELPSRLPFDGVEFFPRQSMRYVSKMDVGAVIAAARDELAANDAEAFKAFALCLLAGLRRNEADKLRWRSVDFEGGLIRVEAQADFAPKAETSLAEVPVDTGLCALLRGYRAAMPKSEYVLDGSSTNSNAGWRAYRAEDTFQRLTAWLRAHGVDSRTPLHTLRKEAGSLVCQKAGLFAASRFLRHADVAITAQHYAAQKDRVTVGLGALLAAPAANVIEAEFKPSEAKPAKITQRRRTA
jgi:integrase